MNINTKLLIGFGLILFIFGATGLYIAIQFKQGLVFVITGFALASTAAVFITIYISQSITGPLQAIKRASTEISKRNFKARVHVKTNDELEQIATIFNKTAAVMDKIDEDYKEIETAKTRFLTITSHELRSPMTPLKAQLQMLQKNYFGPLNKKQRESVDIVLHNANRLDKIIADFLEISRIEAGRIKFEFKKTDVSSLIKETVELMKAYDPNKNMQFKITMTKLPIIEADPDRISQVLRNLISNAIKFSPAHTLVEIQAAAKSDAILISVKDQGIGIASENQPKLFEPFYQVQQTIQGREYEGTGLGLAISRGLVQSQKGKIWVESTLGRGSTFYFTIPYQPVRVIKPLTLLFSETEHIEKHIEEILIQHLGPIAHSEFNELKHQGITERTLYAYTYELVKQNVIDKETANNLRKDIKHVFSSGEKEFETKIEEAFT